MTLAHRSPAGKTSRAAVVLSGIPDPRLNARWHFAAVFAQNTAAKCHLDGETGLLLHAERGSEGPDSEEQRNAAATAHISGCTSRARPWKLRISTNAMNPA